MGLYNEETGEGVSRKGIDEKGKGREGVCRKGIDERNRREGESRKEVSRKRKGESTDIPSKKMRVSSSWPQVSAIESQQAAIISLCALEWDYNR